MKQDDHPVERVRVFLSSSDLEIHTLPDDTSTAFLAAQAIGTSVGSIVKSLLFLLDEEPYLVLVSGDRKVDKRKLARFVGVRKARLADPDQTLAITGFNVGGVSPVALRTSVPVLLDQSLLSYPVVYAAAGSRHDIFPVTPTFLLEITRARLIDSTE